MQDVSRINLDELFFSSSRITNNLLVSRNLFMYLFCRQLQLNALKTDARNLNEGSSIARARSPRIDRGLPSISRQIKKRQYNKCFIEVACSTRTCNGDKFWSSSLFTGFRTPPEARLVIMQQENSTNISLIRTAS